MKRYTIVLLIVLTSACSQDRWNIIEINSLSQALGTLHYLNNKSLVLFDIDKTLVTKNRGYDLDSPLVKAVEPITAQVIKEMQERGIKVMALTRGTNPIIPIQYKTGKHGIIESAQDWRYAKLLLIGIDFSTSFPVGKIVFQQLPILRGKTHPMFYKGILFSAGNDKGVVLGTFLDYIQWKPSKIVFFDDKKEHLDTVGTEMKKRNIPYQGYWYHGATILFQAHMHNINKNQL